MDEIITYREMCERESVNTLQRGMNYRLGDKYSVILMSTRNNSPYQDKIDATGKIIYYEGHDQPNDKTKKLDQLLTMKSGKLTENGKFEKAVRNYLKRESEAEIVRVYQKIRSGIWLNKGLFRLTEFNFKFESNRKICLFTLELNDSQEINTFKNKVSDEVTRIIPSNIIQNVWKRDKGQCVICSSKLHLHYDHYLPFSKGGTSLMEENIRILCRSCNLKKTNRIE